MLISWGFGGLVDEAETIIGELVVNAVQHGTYNSANNGWGAGGTKGHSGNAHPRAARAWARAAWAVPPAGAGQPDEAAAAGLSDGAVLRLCLLRRVGEVMLAVIDASDDAPTPCQPEWIRESGRGLQIVHALSSVWGWSPIEGHGKAVWAVLPYE